MPASRRLDELPRAGARAILGLVAPDGIAARPCRLDEGWVMSRRSIGAGLVALVLAGCASADKPVAIRVVEDDDQVRGCQVLGTVADNDLEDLQEKAARLGADVVLLTPQRKSKGGYFGLQDYMTADAYRCAGAR
jgi:hypothetical protein